MNEGGSNRAQTAARLPWAGTVVAALLGAALLVASVERVVRRLDFDYDLVLWADDYMMTSMMKLRAGLPVYTDIADANSTIYAPGGAYLHYALLAPFGLATSLLANKLLVQVWLALGVVLCTAVAVELARRAEGWERGRAWRAAFVTLTATILALASLTNPTADSLHPTSLEICVLGATMLALARWDRLTPRRRVAAMVILPVLGLLAKQSSGAAVSISLAVAVLAGPGNRAQRALAAVPLASVLAAFLGLTVWTGGGFKTWCVDILRAHPFDWWKATELYEGYGLLFVPVLAVAIYRGVVAFKRADESDLAWRRVAALPVAYAPLAVAGLFKRLGGPNGLGLLGFLVAVLAAPCLVAKVLDVRGGSVRRFAFVVLIGQLLAWYPRRRAPDRADYANAETACSYAAARMRCGDEVLLGRGSVCYQRGGVAVPRDRVMSLIEVEAAGRGDELGFYERIAQQKYDLLIMPIDDLMWFGRPLWQKVKGKYTAFYATEGAHEVDKWYDGWQGISSRPIVFFERISERGTHRIDDAGKRCDQR